MPIKLKGPDCLGDPVITSAASASGTVGTAFSYTITATQSPNSFGVTGTLPPGLSLNSLTGVISGTPTTGGSWTVTLSASNTCCGPGTQNLTITIAACVPPASFSVSCRIQSASKTKCGFPGFNFTSPPTTGQGWDNKRYLQADWSGTDYGPVPPMVYSGTNTMDCAGSSVCGAQRTDGTNTYAVGCYALGGADPLGQITNYNYSETESRCGDGSNPTYISCSTVTVNLSNEYTTAMLSAAVDTALAAASWSAWGGSCYGSEAKYDISTDELTITKWNLDIKVTIVAQTFPVYLHYHLWYNHPDGSGSDLGDRCIVFNPGDTEKIISLTPPSEAGASFSAAGLTFSCTPCP